MPSGTSSPASASPATMSARTPRVRPPGSQPAMGRTFDNLPRAGTSFISPPLPVLQSIGALSKTQIQHSVPVGRSATGSGPDWDHSQVRELTRAGVECPRCNGAAEEDDATTQKLALTSKTTVG